nr:putative reverse transcriptase domain-containing protein [Tanacetum cinerariifolium]GEY48527.1 putative reverse transcriptase domain-containing protein [Tanacetum cinerariifolium]
SEVKRAMLHLDFKIVAYDKNFSNIWSYTTSKDNEDPSWNTSFNTRRTRKTSSALKVLWKTLFVLYLYLLGTLHKLLEFEVGDQVLRRVSPWKGVIRFGKKGKLAPRYVGPFEILERIGPVAYRLNLPEELSSMHDTFHVSNVKKCLADANLHVPLDKIKINKTLRFVEEPVEIMDREVKNLKRSKIPIVKVRWNSKRGPELI